MLMANCGHTEFRKTLILDEDIKFEQFGTTTQHGGDYNNCKTAFSLQCSRERSDDYNF